MPIEIKELRIKAVINTQPVVQQTTAMVFSEIQLEKWKKETIHEALQKMKEYLKDQTER